MDSFNGTVILSSTSIESPIPNIDQQSDSHNYEDFIGRIIW